MTGTSRGREAAIGFRAHSGWACAVLVAGSGEDIAVVDRRRVELCDPKIEGSKQLFHFMEPMPFAEAETFALLCRKSTDALARKALKNIRDIAASNSLKVAGVCITTASGKPLPDLRAILASHALIHAAEGEFYRDALAHAAEAAKLGLSRVKERDAGDWMAARLGISEGQLKTRLAEMGKTLGPPWSADEKLATMAAWLVLAV